MGVAARLGRRAIRLANGALDAAALIAIMLLVAVGLYAMWDSKQVFSAADAAQYEVYKPTAQDEGKSFAELRAMNPEVFAWVTVYGTFIDYPVEQAEDNMKYINTNAEGEYSLSGGIFLDYRCSVDFSDFSSILYGHHMENHAMFGDIGLFADKRYFDAREHGMLYYGDVEHGLTFFAFVHADAYNGEVFRVQIEGEAERQAYLDLLLEMAIHTRAVPVTPNDRIILLSTCSAISTNGRDILLAKITDESYENPFELEETDFIRTALAVDGLPGLWAIMPLWVKAVVIALPPLALLLSLMIKRKRKYRQYNSENIR